MPQYSRFDDEAKVDTGDGAAERPRSMPSAASRVPFRLPSLPAQVRLPNLPSMKAIRDHEWIVTAGLATLLGVLLAVIVVLLVGILGASGRLAAAPPLCDDAGCLRAAARLDDSMNRSVDPCHVARRPFFSRKSSTARLQDFYEFACGNYALEEPPPSPSIDTNAVWILGQQINDKLKTVIEKPIKHGAVGPGGRPQTAESKLKTFFHTCSNMYLRNVNDSKNLINRIHGLGGWSALQDGSYVASHWNTRAAFNKALVGAFALGARPFFGIDVMIDYDRASPVAGTRPYIIELDWNSVLPLSYIYYTRNDTNSFQQRQFYGQFMRSFVQYLWEDAGVSPTNASGHLNDFVQDVITVETAIANLVYNQSHTPHHATHKTVDYMQQHYGEVIQWQMLLNNYFSGGGGVSITDRTQLHLPDQRFIAQLAPMLINSTAFTPRQLNNYIMWRVASYYTPQLGWKYMHANREWWVRRTRGSTKFAGIYNFCLGEAKSVFGHALSAIYARDYYTAATHAATAMLARIDTYAWMDAATTALAKQKITHMTDHVGYPSWLVDNDKLDKYYKGLQISDASHFNNRVSVESFIRSLKAGQLHNGHTMRNQWPTQSVYQPRSYYYLSRNELFFGAGILQPPLYDPTVPQFVNFASIGRYIGTYLTESIDRRGRMYDASGLYKSWWSTQTYNNFKPVFACHEKRYNGSTYAVDGKLMPFITHPRYQLARAAEFDYRLDAATGVAYDAYKQYVADYGNELSLPGLQSLSIDQTFFVALGQSFCTTRSRHFMYFYWSRGNTMPPDTWLNNAVGQNSHWLDAFSCPRKESTCSGF